MQIPKRRDTKSRKYDDSPIPLTSDGLKRLEDRLAKLLRDMPGLIEETQRTAAFGDRSDNAEYKEAKSALRRAQGQIFGMQEQLKRVVKIDPSKNESGKIGLGSTVEVELNGKIKKTFYIVGPMETDPDEGRISHKSPLGAALMGKKKGDIVEITTPGGSSSYLVKDIS